MCSKNTKQPPKFETSVVNDLRDMIDMHIPIAKNFRMAAERFKDIDDQSVRLRLIGRRSRDGRMYNLPTCSEVAALIVDMISVSLYF